MPTGNIERERDISWIFFKCIIDGGAAAICKITIWARRGGVCAAPIPMQIKGIGCEIAPLCWARAQRENVNAPVSHSNLSRRRAAAFAEKLKSGNARAALRSIYLYLGSRQTIHITFQSSSKNRKSYGLRISAHARSSIFHSTLSPCNTETRALNK